MKECALETANFSSISLRNIATENATTENGGNLKIRARKTRGTPRCPAYPDGNQKKNWASPQPILRAAHAIHNEKVSRQNTHGRARRAREAPRQCSECCKTASACARR